MNQSLNANRNTGKILMYAALVLGAVLMIFPFVWMLLTSFKSAGESVQIPPTILPRQWLTDNYRRALTSLPFLHLYVNTTLLILFRVICAVAFSSAAGFAFAKLHFKGKNLLFSLVLVQMMLPSQIFIIPQYQMLAKMGLTNSMFALVFPGLVSAFGTFFLRQAYMGIPDELGEAAYLAGFLSGGTQQKVVIAKWLMADLKLFIFDEPTRGIDVGAKSEIYRLMDELVHQGAAVLMISSDLPEVLGMSDRIYVMSQGKITGELGYQEADQNLVLRYAYNQGGQADEER